MANVGDQLIREVEEDLQRERWLRLWRAYGRLALGTVAVVVLAVAGYTGWIEYRESRLGDDGYRYWLAERQAGAGDIDEAMAAFGALHVDGHGGYPWLAGMREAQLLAEAGERELALQRYDDLAAMDDVLPVWRELAALYAVMLMVDHADPDDVDARLAPLLDGPWRHVALELRGLLYLRTGDAESAAASFEALAADAEAPPSAALRARELLSLTTGGY